jgi:ATP-dependent exoDNAse (exonuclease V) beta subunit
MKDITNQERVQLDEPTHKYTVAGHENLKYESATTWIKSFFPIFNAPAIAQSLIDRYPDKYGDQTKEEILAGWNKIAAIGTSVHNELENWCKSWQALPPEERPAFQDETPDFKYEKSYHGFYWLQENLQPHYQLYPEVKLSNEDLQIAGTVDLLIHDPKQNLWIIADWKTNKSIRASSRSKGTHKATCFLDDCHLSHYSLQMSLYQWMLEQDYTYEGEPIKVVGRNLIHLRPKMTRTYPLGIKVFETPYLIYNLEKMVEYRLRRKAAGKLFEKKVFKTNVKT